MSEQKRYKSLQLNQRGIAYIIVLLIITILTILANYLYGLFQSHTKARKAHEAYSTASEHAEATLDIASSWLAAQENPPEDNLSASTTMRGNTVTTGDLVKLLEENNITGNDLYWLSFNNDGNNDAGFLILPIGASATAGCESDYGPNCAREHYYVIIGRSLSWDNSVVEHKRRVGRAFY